MKTTTFVRLLATTLVGCSASAFASPGALMVSDCWIRTLPGNLPSGAYFSIMNMGGIPIDLTGVASDAFSMAMLHRTEQSGSTSKMIMIEKAGVPAHGSLDFAPGGYHVMLEHPKQPLKLGTSIPLRLVFSDGEHITTQCAVKAANATTP
ncbi:copper chaperone PCu(A)C [Burkholderia gladioli]|uniref:copper chaperone PCu(A)C n=1 Tax=Burkholderia gladioli TaxID=28095 RepID=UPI00064AF003|nr:copper chaperone PCu(A)C [Burkholderia gladioli]MDA0576284.1 copper chaperone PCu(A)C [Burkholderia gladioli]MDA0604358.1 copper chaperone PCu(A)C [Burkholderia gladioli]